MLRGLFVGLFVLARIAVWLWLPVLVVAWVTVAQSDTKREQNYEMCDANAAGAFAGGNLEDQLHSTRETRIALFALQDDLRRTCMRGKGYVISPGCGSPLLEAPSRTITLQYCFRRTALQSIVAQVR
jgi:hypothetical protein